MIRDEVSLSVRSRTAVGGHCCCRCPWGQVVVAGRFSDQQRNTESDEEEGLGGQV